MGELLRQFLQRAWLLFCIQASFLPSDTRRCLVTRHLKAEFSALRHITLDTNTP